jgi:hypothetical protein
VVSSALALPLSSVEAAQETRSPTQGCSGVVQSWPEFSEAGLLRCPQKRHSPNLTSWRSVRTNRVAKRSLEHSPISNAVVGVLTVLLTIGTGAPRAGSPKEVGAETSAEFDNVDLPKVRT